MYQKTSLGMVELKKIADAAIAYASEKKWIVTIAIVDDGGHLQWLQRMDGAPPATAYVAAAKARTAAMGQRESKFYEDMISAGRPAFLSAPGLDCLLEGGVPITIDNSCAGAIGVSGVRSNEDSEIARAGIAALG